MNSTIGIKVIGDKIPANGIMVIRKYDEGLSISKIKELVSSNNYIFTCDYISRNGIEKVLSLYNQLEKLGITCELYEHDRLTKIEFLNNLIESYSETEREVEYDMDMEATFMEIDEKCEKGNVLAEQKKFEDALIEFKDALELVPTPVYDYETSTWIFTAIGDMNFWLGNYSDALNNFMEAMKCPNGIGNPFICARIGECFYEMNNLYKAREYLLQAFMLDGKDVFSDVDEKYYNLISSLI